MENNTDKKICECGHSIEDHTLKNIGDDSPTGYLVCEECNCMDYWKED